MDTIFSHYKPFPRFKFKDRTWPDNDILKAPRWVSVDLRDGNQALMEPMGMEKKLDFFNHLIKIGFKEIEVGFPAASDTDYKFIRHIIENELIPDDVTIQVLTQAREELIVKTFESLIGTKQAIVHFYNSTSLRQREVVFKMDKESIGSIAKNGAFLVKTNADMYPDTKWSFEYSPESFTGTEIEYALDVCNSVINILIPSEQPIIINLPATVEMHSAATYADQIEYFSKNIDHRENVLISVHTHNDRGSAIAAAELAICAGADRVEGCIFGNGERTGNVDIVAMALNMSTHGINSELDLSDLPGLVSLSEHCTGIEVHPRHPYAGELVFTAFSGSHQDAIKKGLAAQKDGAFWDVPYIPINPKHIGRNYDAIIRVNSQSGKGGVAYLMENNYNLHLPRALQIELSRYIKDYTDQTGTEINAPQIYQIFKDKFIDVGYPYNELKLHHVLDQGDVVNIRYTLNDVKESKQLDRQDVGDGPIEAFVNALPWYFELLDYSEHSLSKGSNAQAVAYVSGRIPNGDAYYGVGIDNDILQASFKAILASFNKSLDS